MVYFGFGARRKRKIRKAQEDNEINNYSGFCLQLLSFMYGSLTIFRHAFGYLVMICQFHGGLHGLTVVFPSLAISWIAMLLWVLLLFSGWFSCAFGCGLSY